MYNQWVRENKAGDSMEEKVRLAYLFDFYGELLNSKQREIFEAFVFQDLSLQEMADESGVSRQAIHDKVRRSIHALEEYEEKLGLLEKNRRINEIAEQLESKFSMIPDAAADNRNDILSLLEDLREVL